MQSKLPDREHSLWLPRFLGIWEKKKWNNEPNFIAVLVPCSRGGHKVTKPLNQQLQTTSSLVYSLPKPLQGNV